MKKERLAIIDGIRTPIGKNYGNLKDMHAVELGVHAVSSLLGKTTIKHDMIDELIFGNVAQPSDSANIARVIALNASLHKKTPAFTVHRNCASGMEAITTSMLKILHGEADIIIAGGTESMSNIPLLFNKHMTKYFANLNNKKIKGFDRLKHILSFRPYFLKPRIGLLEGLTDPTCNIIMGDTAENLAKEFGITREEQDQFAVESHQKYIKAQKKEFYVDEIAPIYNHYTQKTIDTDEGPRGNLTMEKMTSFRPYFDRTSTGTVTIANSCSTNDGACAVLLMSESKAKEMNLNPIGFVRDFAYCGLDAHRMGLGPVYATKKVFDKTGLTLKDMDFIEINEAFASQVLSCIKAFQSDSFCQKELGLKKNMGEIDMKKLNVNGGAIALGHPVGITGTRIILTLLRQLEKNKKNMGLATLCVGGGQGGAVIVEKS